MHAELRTHRGPIQRGMGAPPMRLPRQRPASAQDFHSRGIILLAILLTLRCSLAGAHATTDAASQAAEPSTQITLPEGPLKITITGVEGIVQVRTAAGEKWQKATAGMDLNEGAEFRTGPHSAVRFVIPPDQTVALDRLGTVKVLRANFENGKLFTDLGMKYGRTRYDIESAGREHDAKVHSPSSVLAVRGTKVSLYDQPPFAPEAISLTGRAVFRDAKKVVSFGGKNAGKTKVDQNSDSPAAAALTLTQADPKGVFAGRTQSDLYFQLASAAYGGSDFSNVGVLSFLNKPGTVIGVLPVKEQLLINLTFANTTPDAAVQPDVNLVITDPKGQVLSATQTTTADGGIFRGKTFDAATNQGQINADWSISFPKGTYTFTETLKAGTSVSGNLQITELNPNTLASTNVGPISSTLTPQNPTFTFSDSFPKLPQTPTAARRSRR